MAHHTLEKGAPRNLSPDEIAFMLSRESSAELDAIFAAAYSLKLKCCGKGVSVRGLVESGNVCAKDCYYCGIRRSNATVERYGLAADEIVAAAEEANSLGYASLVIQSGEIESEGHTLFIEEVLQRIAPLDMGVI